MITLKDIHFHYHDDEFRINIPKLIIGDGSRTAIVGPSGSGKTTFLRLISGIISPMKGKIIVNDEDVSQMDDSTRRNFRISNIGFVFQEFELIEYLSVFENILLPYFINRSMKLNSSVRLRATELAVSMNLGNLLNREIGNISQGEKQRVAVCRALLIEPKIILADEPTGNLDPKNKERIIEILFECAENSRATLLIVTHDHSLLKGFDRIIDFGNLLAAGRS